MKANCTNGITRTSNGSLADDDQLNSDHSIKNLTNDKMSARLQYIVKSYAILDMSHIEATIDEKDKNRYFLSLKMGVK